MNDMLTAALDYAAHGLPVFPCKRTDKSPLIKGGFHAATTDANQIKAWWTRWPIAMIGMATGNGIDVLDLDVKKGKNGFAAVPNWEMLSPIVVRTPSDPKLHTDGAPSEGGHLWFKSNGGTIKGTHDEIALGVDTRGVDGYVIVPPSSNEFGVYRFEKCGLDRIPKLPAFPADLRPPSDLRSTKPEATEPLPDWLLDLIKSSPGGGLSQEPEDLPPRFTQAEAKAALSVIFDIGRREWIGIGCGLYKHFGDEAGFELWDDWSSANGGSNYKPRTIHKQWRSIVRGDGYGWDIGTLIYHANEVDPNWRSNIEPEESALVEELAATDEPVLAEPAQTKPVTERPEPKQPSAKPDAGALIISSSKFIAGFKPPDYLIEGLLQRRFLYSMTGQTNTGKTTVALRLAAQVAQGLSLGEWEIEQGKVLFFAGENPDDIRMRWIKLCEEMKIDKETDQVFWVAGVYSIRKMRKVIDTQTTKCGPFALVIIDSSAAYFEGKDENDNTELGNYARMLRTLVEISGGPTVMVLCHPVKNANPDSLLPRGGGAFLNEVDGNLVLMTVSEAPKVVDLHWHGKFRGPDFSPIPFALTAGTSEQIKDSKGRPIWTITARMLSTQERAATEDRGQVNQDKLIGAMKAKEEATLVDLARSCGWYYKSGDPNKSLVERTMHDCEARRLVKKEGGRWKLTKAGLATDTESF